MGVFIRTFIICIVLCVVWTVYSYFDGNIGGNLDVTSTEVYKNIEKNIKEKIDNPTEDVNVIAEEEKPQKAEPAKKQVDKPLPVSKNKKMKIYFLNSKAEAVWVYREDEGANLEVAIKYLLKGITSAENKKGIYSEIPKNVKLLSLKNYDDKIIVDLSSDFVKDGGTTAILNRIDQLVKTVDAQNSYKKPIYLHINGKRVEYIGGDGVYLKQPLNSK